MNVTFQASLRCDLATARKLGDRMDLICAVTLNPTPENTSQLFCLASEAVASQATEQNAEPELEAATPSSETSS